jgi:hypothetical protein
MSRFLWFLSAAALVQTAWPASLTVSTFLKDGFTPTAIAADPHGNVYIAGSSVIDPTAETTSAVVAKVNSKASQYLYLTYFDSAASDQISAVAVDSAGNAYITGWTGNPNFPSTDGGALGTAPTSSSDLRSFVAKLNPQGVLVFAVLIGGSVASTARGIAVTPQGQILVSGIAKATGFPVTQGAYSVADSSSHWFLMELDVTASKTILSATGIGGSSIVVDGAGNVYLAGSSTGTDYPTTPGAYQTTFVQGYTCSFLCQLGFPGGLQHVTKVDPTASKLIYSTGLNDIKGSAGSTNNTGLAVDTKAMPMSRVRCWRRHIRLPSRRRPPMAVIFPSSIRRARICCFRFHSAAPVCSWIRPALSTPAARRPAIRRCLAPRQIRRPAFLPFSPGCPHCASRTTLRPSVELTRSRSTPPPAISRTGSGSMDRRPALPRLCWRAARFGSRARRWRPTCR